MRILLLNPNTSASMTQKIADTARQIALDCTEIIAVNPVKGPASIEGYFDEALSLAGIIETVQQQTNVDAIVLACFDDTGLDAVRCMSDKPVIGIGEAGYHAASLVSNKFSVVTTLACSVPALEHNLNRYGFGSRCAKVRSTEIPVLDLEKHTTHARERIKSEIVNAIEQEKAEAIVLGCAGMTDLADSLSRELGLPVIDGVGVAITLAESLVRLGIKTSRLGGYSPPRAKS